MATVDGYATLLREKAGGVNFVEKFYLGMFDNPVPDLARG